MSDILSGIGDAAYKAADFILPGSTQHDAGLGVGSLMQDLVDTARNTSVGAATSVYDIATGEGSLSQKLLMGGLAAAGVAGGIHGARQLAAAKHLERNLATPALAEMAPPEPVHPMVRAMGKEAVSIGDQPIPNRPFVDPAALDGLGGFEQPDVPDLPDMATTRNPRDLIKRTPGKMDRISRIANASNFDEAAQALTASDDFRVIAHGGWVMEQYANQLTDVADGQAGAAMHDFARAAAVVENGILRTGKNALNADFSKTWDKFAKGLLVEDIMNPQEFTSPKVQSLMAGVKAIADATNDIAAPDLTISLTSKVDRVDLVPGGLAQVLVSDDTLQWDTNRDAIFPQVFSEQADSSAAMTAAAEERAKRWRAMNVRPGLDRFKDTLRYLYDRGMAGEDLPKPLATHDWYRTGYDEITRAADEMNADGHDWVTRDNMSAAISLVSAATDWSVNVDFAKRALEMAASPEVLDPKFVSFLDDPLSATPPARSRAVGDYIAAHPNEAALFERLHKDLTTPVEGKEAVFVSKADLRKVLRLRQVESAADVFSATGGMKQKNFYVNLLDPADPHATTVDRHMHDIFFGVATAGDFKMLTRSSLGESNYDLLAEAIRDVAKERNALPNQIQGITWDVWRMLKGQYDNMKGTGWRQRNPFRLNEIIDGQLSTVENEAYNAVRGRPTEQLAAAMASVPTSMPYVVGKVDGVGLNVLPDGTLGVRISKLNPESAGLVRHLAPGLRTPDGTFMLRPKAPRVTLDVNSLVRGLDQQVTGHRVETWAASDFPETHPALLPGIHIAVEHGDGWTLSRDIGATRLKPASPATVSESKFAARNIPADELTWDSLADPEVSPLVKNAWGAISAERPGMDNATRTNQLRARLHELGYSFKEAVGRYTDQDTGIQAPEQSFLVFGIDQKTLTQLGKEFDQESVLSNERFFYTGGENAGKSRPVNPDGISLSEKPGQDGTYLRMGDRDFVFNADIDWKTLEDVPATQNADRTARRQNISYVTLKPEQAADIQSIVEQIEGGEGKKAGKVTGVYAPGKPPKGWKVAHESVHADGVNVAVVRTADRGLDARHGAQVWVRDLGGLPKADPEGQRLRKALTVRQMSDGSKVVDNLVVVQPPPGATPGKGLFDYSLDGKKPTHVSVVPAGVNGPLPTIVPGWGEMTNPDAAAILGGHLVLTPSPDDLMPAVNFIDAMGDAGFDVSKIQVGVGGDALDALGTSKVANAKDWATTVTGQTADVARRQGAGVPELIDKFGIQADVDYWDGGKLTRLPQEQIDLIGPTVSKFMDAHRDMGITSDLKRIRVTVDPNEAAPAWFAIYDTGEMTLNAHWWKDPADLAFTRAEQQESHEFGPMLPADGTAVIAHELGHMLHKAVTSSFRSTADAKAFAEELYKSWKSDNPTPVLQGITVSTYAATDSYEFMAEALSEAVMLGDNARQVPREIYKKVVEQYNHNQRWLNSPFRMER